MTDIALAIAFALFAWWFSTIVILYLDGLHPRTFRHTLRGSTVVLGLALWGLVHTRDDVSAAGAYYAFVCALLVWAWQEVAFLLGVVTGPRRSACPPGACGWRRAGYALQAVLYHEFALVMLAVAVLTCVGDGANRTGVWTFMVLWAMRQSAKLNVFLGVRNLGESFLPPHLAYLTSYFQRRPMNVLFPLSVTIAIVAAVAVWWHLLTLDSHAPGRTALALTGTLLALGALEHWLLVLPLPTEALWRWGLTSHRGSGAAAVPAAGQISTPR
jgi:putative photosynthetic complex assembly protein 2